MNTYRLGIAANFIFTPGVIALAFGLEGYWFGLPVVLGAGLWGWISWNRDRGNWNTDLYFAGMILMVTLGVFFELMPALLVVAVLGALAGWDLLRFLERINASRSAESIAELEKPHIARLGFALLGGGILAAIALSARIQISFGIALLLAGILIISLGQFVRLFSN